MRRKVLRLYNPGWDGDTKTEKKHRWDQAYIYFFLDVEMSWTNRFMNMYRISSNRLKGYDYTSWCFFVTICTKDREHYFWEIINGNMVLNEIGRIAHQYRLHIPVFSPNIRIDEFVVMPNHIHGIVFFKNVRRDTISRVSWEWDARYCVSTNTFGPQSHNLWSMIRGFKSSVKKYATIHKIIFDRQSNYYDHIIIDKIALYNIKQYIQNNPQKRYRDRNNWMDTSDDMWMYM